MSDLIDRQAAIEAIEQMQMPIMRSEFPEEQFVFTGMSEALQAIKELPSAQQWILFRAEKPKGGQQILACSEDGVMWMTAYSALNNLTGAWMPLPEPYKGEQE